MFLFLNAKCKHLFSNKLKAAKLAWTALYRKAHKKDQSTEATRRKRRSNKVSQARSIVGASLEVIQKRRNEKSDVRAAARENALRCGLLTCARVRQRADAPASTCSEIKERVKKAKEAKQATKKSDAAKPKAAAPKAAGGAPKGGKAGGKR